jgi:sulfite reductase (NADPH) flavoprotein alpha-component
MIMISAKLFWLCVFAICISIVTYYWNYRGKKLLPAQKPAAAGAKNKDVVLVAFASQSGFAESIAWKTAGILQSWGLAVETVALGSLDSTKLAKFRRVLFIVSTTGTGEAPDNARNFAKRDMHKPMKLPELSFAVLALGNRSHENYCEFGRKLDRWLRASGAVELNKITEVDNADPGALKLWDRNLDYFKQNSTNEAPTTVQYYRWKLVERTLLNAGSAGGSVYLLALYPFDMPPLWREGDIVEIFPGPAEEAVKGTSTIRHREYSVASLPADGRLELVIRQVQMPDSEPGLCSSWLTQKIKLNERIMLRIRSNRYFHGPEDERPMILIGNGTGIAGLRAHLKSRSLLGYHENWIIYGERNSEFDWLFRDEIMRFQKEGHIKRLDLAFSRDQSEKVYVQHLLNNTATTLKEWVQNGACIYVCGSLEGMSTGVRNSMSSILGEENFLKLVEEGRYRCDVY